MRRVLMVAAVLTSVVVGTANSKSPLTEQQEEALFAYLTKTPRNLWCLEAGVLSMLANAIRSGESWASIEAYRVMRTPSCTPEQYANMDAFLRYMQEKQANKE